MLFASLSFLVFLPATLLATAIVPQRYRWLVLLAASYVFYAAAKLEYVALLVLATAVSYASGLVMARHAEKRRRRPALVIGLVANLCLLFAFKYVPFGISVIEAVSGGRIVLPHPEIVVPVGISFYTFRVVSYLVDVYRGTITAERHAGYYALFVSFFPLLLSGPLERGQRLLPRLRTIEPATGAAFREAVLRILLGFVKKVVLADRISVMIAPILTDTQDAGSLALLLTTYAYTFQMYFDFSGYTDIAIGTAKLFGIEVSENFRRPLLSPSIPEFWRRWHITLMSWFRDYIFVPLGGMKAKGTKLVAVTALVFVISGIWHGAGAIWVLWGVIHAFYMTMAIALAPATKRIARAVEGTWGASLWKAGGTLLTFHLLSISLVLFWCGSLDGFWDVIKAITFDLRSTVEGSFAFAPRYPRELAGYFFHFDLAVVLAVGGVLMIAEKIVDDVPARANRMKRYLSDGDYLSHTAVRWGLAYLAIACLVFFGKWDGGKFLYFQF